MFNYTKNIHKLSVRKDSPFTSLGPWILWWFVIFQNVWQYIIKYKYNLVNYLYFGFYFAKHFLHTFHCMVSIYPGHLSTPETRAILSLLSYSIYFNRRLMGLKVVLSLPTFLTKSLGFCRREMCDPRCVERLVLSIKQNLASTCCDK